MEIITAHTNVASPIFFAKDQCEMSHVLFPYRFQFTKHLWLSCAPEFFSSKLAPKMPVPLPPRWSDLEVKAPPSCYHLYCDPGSLLPTFSNP